MPISVLVADDHAVVAEGLTFLINTIPDMKVVSCVQDGREAVQHTLQLRPDVAVIDHGMPHLNGTEAAHVIRTRCPSTRTIILSMHSNEVHVLRALKAGALGYIVKRSAAKEVVAAIRSVHMGIRYLSPELVHLVLDQVLSDSPDIDALGRLSSRERQVLQLLAEGRATNDIAHTLALSPKTVETYRGRMMEKLGIHDLAGLIKFAIQHGLVSLE